jgi:NMD protein affecting ribosome stability and mRNA decay
MLDQGVRVLTSPWEFPVSNIGSDRVLVSFSLFFSVHMYKCPWSAVKKAVNALQCPSCRKFPKELFQSIMLVHVNSKRNM